MTSTGDPLAGALLKVARGRSGLSQRAFADLIGIAQPTLSAYESGRRQPTLPTLLGMLHRSGWDLSLDVTPRDDHDEVLANWERSLDDDRKDRLRAQGYRLVSDGHRHRVAEAADRVEAAHRDALRRLGE